MREGGCWYLRSYWKRTPGDFEPVKNSLTTWSLGAGCGWTPLRSSGRSEPEQSLRRRGEVTFKASESTDSSL